MGLGLHGSGSDRRPCDEISEILRHDRIKEFGRCGKFHADQFQQELAGKAEPFLDIEGAVEVGIVNQPFPAERCARLLKIGAHDQHHFRGDFLLKFFQRGGIFQRRGNAVDGAGARDDEDTAVLAENDVFNFFSESVNGIRLHESQREFLKNLLRSGERVLLGDIYVVNPACRHLNNSSFTAFNAIWRWEPSDICLRTAVPLSSSESPTIRTLAAFRRSAERIWDFILFSSASTAA